MKLGINATILDPQPSGLGRYTASITNELARRFDDLVVFSSCGDGLALGPGSLVSVSARVSPSSGRFGHVNRWYWAQFRLPGQVRKLGIEVLLSTVPEGVVGAHFRQVIVVHDLSPLVFPTLYPRLNLYFRHVVPRLLRSATAIVCVSDFTRAEVQRWYSVPDEKLHVVYEGVSIGAVGGHGSEPFHPNSSPAEYLLCVASELSPRKNLQFMIRSLSAVLRERRHLDLIIVGKRDGRFLPGLQALSDEEGVGRQVRFVGYVDDATLAGLYSGARMLVYSSLYEGFGLPMLEAMSLGVPVLTFDVSCLPEIAGDAAKVVAVGDAQALQSAARMILDDQRLAEDLVRRGRERAALFSWERAGIELAAVIRSVV